MEISFLGDILGLNLTSFGGDDTLQILWNPDMNHTIAGLLNTKNRDSMIHLYSSQLRVSAQTIALFFFPLI